MLSHTPVNMPATRSCLSCSIAVSTKSKALCCDLCEGWAHIKCIGVSPEAHGLHSSMEGLPWFCPNCIAEVRSLKTAMSELTDDNKALLAQAKESEEEIKNLQSQIAKLSEDIKFLTHDTVTPDTVSKPMEHQPHRSPKPF